MNNLDAFLTMISTSEGTRNIPGGDNGYRVIVGSTPEHPILMDSYVDHPRRLVELGPGLSSTAAGRYQILERYYDAYRKQLRLLDFSPASQDAIATQMIREHDALEDVHSGAIRRAIFKCSNIWASLPGNGYGQRENTVAVLTEAFLNAGGTLQLV